MSANAKNIFRFSTTAIGSLPLMNRKDWFNCLDQVDIAFYPEFPNEPGHMMLDYSLGHARQERQIIFEDFCHYLKQNNKVACKLQWCGLLTFAHYHSEIDQYLNSLVILADWANYITREIPSIQKMYIFLDEPALINADLSKINPHYLTRFYHLLKSLSADLYVHCCGHLPEKWPEIYAEYGLSFDLALNQKSESYFDRFPKLALGVTSQNLHHISSSVLERTQLVTPACGLTSYSKSQVIEILSNLRKI